MAWIQISMDPSAAAHGVIFSLEVKLESEFGKIRWI
jgi:hypothetical protein